MSPAPFTLDRARLDPVLAPIARAHGAEVMDVEFKSEPSGWVLRIFVEKFGSAERKASTREAAVDLDTCSKIARDLSPALDVVEVVAHRYHLEVSTPGVERPLRTEADFSRFAGEKAKVKLERAVQGQKVLVGILGETKGGSVTLVDGPRSYEFLVADVTSARLVFEFPKSEKPGKGPGKKGAPTSRRSGDLSGPPSSRAVGAPESAPASSPSLSSDPPSAAPSSKRVQR
ncbi:MAG: ribosome maturation factor RimP [Myxococcales bacterium]|nr:ribosome maturation factor RimP [Myxococcales bacterium]